MGANKTPIETAIVDFYRDEIRLRYQLECLHEIPEFSTISDSMLDELREFFLERLYPSADVRVQMDEAFEDLGHLLRSPGRLTPLIGAAVSTMLRLSFHLPAIISTGIAAVDAIRKTRKLEADLMAVADTMRPELEEALGKRKGAPSYRRVMLRLIASVPEDTVRGLIADVIQVFRALSDVKMLTGMLHFGERCMSVMESREKVYTAKDRESMKLCLEVLRGGHSLFVQLKPKDFPKILKGIERVETTWYEGVRTQVGNLSD
jgi:hypothetical protein